MKIISCSILVLLQVTTLVAISSLCNPPVSDWICPEASEIKYNLYTENTNTPPTQIVPEQIASMTYNSGCPFIFITHGFTDYATDPWILDMANEFFKKGCFNIIVVDWSKISSVANYTDLVNYVYPYTAFRTCCSGEYVGQFMIDLNVNFDINYKDMTFVGHSLGAHFAGCAGQYVRNQTGQHVGRVTGLDPAGPMFLEISTNCRLSPDDAEFVDCIHTDKFEAGYATALGYMDFFPNGGAQQPGCPFNTNATIPLACNHFFSVFLYTASINTRGFTSNKCNNYLSYEANLCSTKPQSEMGYDAKKSTSGSYYLDTLANAPYVMNGKTHASSAMPSA